MASDQVLKQINRSGFPFQLAMEHEIDRTTREHDWYVASREHPWTNNENGSSGYIDLVLEHNRLVTIRLVVECKRVKADDARQLRWMFLVPDAHAARTETATCFEVEGRGGRVQSGAYQWRDFRIWDNVRLTPESTQSEFSIITSDEPKRQPLLERMATEVLDSIEGLAEEEVRIKKSLKADKSSRLFIFPAIITNAELVVCNFKPGDINKDDGTLELNDVEVETVPFIRFRKSLAASFPKGIFHGLRAANKARERTVFIVNASSIVTFLSGWQFRPMHDGSYAIQKVSDRSEE